jgi:hypothetical protein
MGLTHLTIVGRLDIIHVLNEAEAVHSNFIQERGVTQIMRHHNRRV